MQSEMKGQAGRENCSDQTMRIYDSGAFMLIGLAVALGVVQPSAAGHGGQSWFAVTSSLLAGIAMIGSVIAGAMRRHAEGDEYLRRLAGVAAATGFYATFTIFLIWLPLAPDMLPAPTGDSMIAILLATTGLGWSFARTRG